MTDRVMAAIVVYRPDPERLRENIRAIRPQVGEVLLVCNGRESRDAVSGFSREEGVSLLCNETNAGIAAALNQAMRYGQEQRYAWVITLDQDSVAPGDLVRVLSAHADRSDAGILAPAVRDRNKPDEAEPDGGWSYVDRCITSASMTRVAAWQDAGGFTEKLFIDYVDYDFCMKLRRAGWRVLCDSGAVLLHEVGHIRTVRIGKHRFDLFNHSPVRSYYHTRNVLYYCREHADLADVRKEKRDLRMRNALILLFEKDRMKKLAAMLRGRRDARKL